MTTVQSMIATLMSRAAGNTLRGLSGEEAARKATMLAVGDLLRLWEEEVPIRPRYMLSQDQGLEQERAAKAAILADRADQGQRNDLAFDVGGGPLVQQLADAFVREHRERYGLRDEADGADVLAANHERLIIVRNALAERYRLEGEPPGARELRTARARAIAASWEAAQAAEQAKKRHRHCHTEESEAGALAAHEAQVKADAEVTQIQRELYRRYAISVER